LGSTLALTTDRLDRSIWVLADDGKSTCAFVRMVFAASHEGSILSLGRVHGIPAVRTLEPHRLHPRRGAGFLHTQRLCPTVGQDRHADTGQPLAAPAAA